MISTTAIDASYLEHGATIHFRNIHIHKLLLMRIGSQLTADGQLPGPG